MILTIIVLLSPNVGKGRPDTYLEFEEGTYQIVAVGEIRDDRIELLLAEVEHISKSDVYGLRYYRHEPRYYRLKVEWLVEKLGLTTFGEEDLEGSWIVVKKLEGIDYQILPEPPLEE